MLLPVPVLVKLLQDALTTTGDEAQLSTGISDVVLFRSDVPIRPHPCAFNWSIRSTSLSFSLFSHIALFTPSFVRMFWVPR